MSEELRPCHRCGCENIYIAHHKRMGTNFDDFSVGCRACGESLTGFDAKDDAIITWNTRPIEDALRAELARKDELLKRLEVFVDRLAEGYDIYWSVDDEILVDDFRAAIDGMREQITTE